LAKSCCILNRISITEAISLHINHYALFPMFNG
jgi:hypothetical protein